MVTPKTLLRWHRERVRRKWTDLAGKNRDLVTEDRVLELRLGCRTLVRVHQAEDPA
jgi:hypothetical protein